MIWFSKKFRDDEKQKFSDKKSTLLSNWTESLYALREWKYYLF